jgi:two-component system response regulator MtrA
MQPNNNRAVILLVETDVAFAEMLRDQLSVSGYRVWLAASGAEAEILAEEVSPDLVIMELMLPDMNGLMLCTTLRERWAMPILVCTASSRAEDAVLSLKLGADDFVRKPFPADELEARIGALLRRRIVTGVHPTPPEARQVIGPLVIDRARCQVTQGGSPINLTPTEYRLLSVMAERPNHVLSTKELTGRIWGYYDTSVRRTLEVHLRRLRVKLASQPASSLTVTARRGLGYELTCWPFSSPHGDASSPLGGTLCTA